MTGSVAIRGIEPTVYIDWVCGYKEIEATVCIDWECGYKEIEATVCTDLEWICGVLCKD